MKFVIFLILVMSFSAFGHDTYLGNLKSTGAQCSLEIEQIYFEGNIETNENFRADIVVSLDDGHGHKASSLGEEFRFTVKLSSNPLIYSGFGDNTKDQLNIITTDGRFNNMSMYAVKWLHGSHFHSAQCLNLKYANH